MPSSLSKSRNNAKKKRATVDASESTRRKLSRKLTKYWARVKQIATRSKVPIKEARRRYSASVVELTVRTPEREVRQRFIDTTPPGTPPAKRKYAKIEPGKPRKLAFASKKRYTKKYVDRIIKTQRYVAGVRRVVDLTGMPYRTAQRFLRSSGLWRNVNKSPKLFSVLLKSAVKFDKEQRRKQSHGGSKGKRR